MSEDIRDDATKIDLLSAIKLAVASHEIGSKAAAFDLIAWIIDKNIEDDYGPRRAPELFLEAIRQTKDARAEKMAAAPRVFSNHVTTASQQEQS